MSLGVDTVIDKFIGISRLLIPASDTERHQQKNIVYSYLNTFRAHQKGSIMVKQERFGTVTADFVYQ